MAATRKSSLFSTARPSRGIGQEVVAVDALAAQCDEEAIRGDVARIDRGAAERGHGRGLKEAAAGGGQQVFETDRRRHTATRSGTGRV
jgi:hypothetical protein